MINSEPTMRLSAPGVSAILSRSALSVDGCVSLGSSMMSLPAEMQASAPNRQAHWLSRCITCRMFCLARTFCLSRSRN